MGNRRSVQKALEHVGARAEITRDPQHLAGADGVVLPGVGAFPRAMQNLAELGLAAPLRAAAASGQPMLGICLGMQLLFDGSEEFVSTAGLGLIAGVVTPLETGGLRVPHIGWNEVRFQRASPLTADLPATGGAFYHVHSLAARPARDSDVIATTEYGERFATIVGHGAIFGVQFHPEKSSALGLRMLATFTRMCRGDAIGPGATAAATLRT
ncbi:MAG: imidazole glycerol-phosphate synthase subunit HisH [Solirubrobacteraceae bacterium]|nr:imidazole glycerol-phosphate synthase subunit HisH [Solirubrobacteraceae bacterium]